MTETTPRMFQALRILEKEVPPTLYGHAPYWRPPVTPPSRTVLIPSWNWRSVHADGELPEDDQPITVDINGAFLAALGAVQVAHGKLVRKGAIDSRAFQPRFETTVWPGYYRIEVIRWAFSGTLVSPLGDSARLETDSQVWVSHPTLVLLLELLAENSIGDLIITDSWVAQENRRIDFRDWSARLKQTRNELLDAMLTEHGTDRPADCTCEPCAKYAAFKEGYGAAFSMMLTGEKCTTYRPDWAHAVYAQHAAAAWRKAWKLSAIGPVLSMGAVDEITLLNCDLIKAIQKPKPPVRWDPTGRQLGHLKRKEKAATTAPAPAAADDYFDDGSDIL